MTLDALHLGAGGYPNAVEMDRRLLRRLFGGQTGRLTGFIASPGTGMQVAITAGEAIVDGRVSDAQGNYYVSDPLDTTKAWPAAPIGNNRIDSLVLAVGDLQYGALGSALSGTQGPQWVVVQGTPAASPTAPTDAAITTAVGAGGWERWYDVQVNVGDTSLNAGRITSRAPSAAGGSGGFVNFKPNWTAAAGWSIASARRLQVAGPLHRWELEVTRTGAQIVATASGSITDTVIGTLTDVTMRPVATERLTFYRGGQAWIVTIDTSGVLTLVAQQGGSGNINTSSSSSVRGFVPTA